MTKHFLLLAALILSMQVIAQTGIGTTTPHASAKLEVASNRQGFLPPQVTLTSKTDNTTIRNAAGTAITPAVG
jgi:type IV secretory pathway ATPase VirB11/archaellum biosynthesis ATPase